MKVLKTTKLNIGNKIIIKYNGKIVNFGQCYDKMAGVIVGYAGGNRWTIALDTKSREKIKEINYRTNNCWTTQPIIPFQYVHPQGYKELELE